MTDKKLFEKYNSFYSSQTSFDSQFNNITGNGRWANFQDKKSIKVGFKELAKSIMKNNKPGGLYASNVFNIRVLTHLINSQDFTNYDEFFDNMIETIAPRLNNFQDRTYGQLFFLLKACVGNTTTGNPYSLLLGLIDLSIKLSTCTNPSEISKQRYDFIKNLDDMKLSNLIDVIFDTNDIEYKVSKAVILEEISTYRGIFLDILDNGLNTIDKYSDLHNIAYKVFIGRLSEILFNISSVTAKVIERKFFKIQEKKIENLVSFFSKKINFGDDSYILDTSITEIADTINTYFVDIINNEVPDLFSEEFMPKYSVSNCSIVAKPLIILSELMVNLLDIIEIYGIKVKPAYLGNMLLKIYDTIGGMYKAQINPENYKRYISLLAKDHDINNINDFNINGLMIDPSIKRMVKCYYQIEEFDMYDSFDTEFMDIDSEINDLISELLYNIKDNQIAIEASTSESVLKDMRKNTQSLDIDKSNQGKDSRNAIKQVQRAEVGQSTKGYKKHSKVVRDQSQKVYNSYKKYKDNEQKIDSQLVKAVQALKTAFLKDDPVAIIEGKKYTPIGVLKTMLGTAAMWNLNKVGAVLFLISRYYLSKKATQAKRTEMVRELDMEIEMLQEKIEDAKGDNNRKAKYQMMRTQKELEKTRDKLLYGIKTADKHLKTGSRMIKGARMGANE